MIFLIQGKDYYFPLVWMRKLKQALQPGDPKRSNCCLPKDTQSGSRDYVPSILSQQTHIRAAALPGLLRTTKRNIQGSLQRLQEVDMCFNWANAA